jgi:hypothetical protein
LAYDQPRLQVPIRHPAHGFPVVIGFNIVGHTLIPPYIVFICQCALYARIRRNGVQSVFLLEMHKLQSAAIVTACDLAAALNDRTVETSFPACLASALKQINRDYLRLRRAV